MESTRIKIIASNSLLIFGAVIAAFLAVLVIRASQTKTVVAVTEGYVEVQGAMTTRVEPSQSVSNTNLPVAEESAAAPAVPSIAYEQANSVAVLVNKKHPLPDNFVPASLTELHLEGADNAQMTEEAAIQLRKLFEAAAAAGVPLRVSSAYRSFEEQATVYNSFVTGYSASYADTTSARPGYSEHQSGLAVDVGGSDGVCELDVCFADTTTGKWLATHAHLYGYVIRYPKDKESVTGYEFEPWHIRYFGVGLASKLYSTGETYEEYLNVPGGDYEN